MRTLHVAALPFPSPQGTQGLLHAMLDALAVRGHDTHLLCYAHRAPGYVDHSATSYVVHRALGEGRSLRSGPSREKLWLDLGLALSLRRLVQRLAPRVVVAHHVEAALCALAVSTVPVLFVAHTSLRHELPTYFPRALALPARSAGGRVDALIVRRAARVLAVSPLLASLLAVTGGRAVSALPLPWTIGAVASDGERVEARRALGLTPAHEVALYAGNLDAYQGLEPMLDALAALAPRRRALRFLLATASPPARIMGALRARRLSSIVHFASLASEAARRRVHAAADVALVPRLSDGGVPIKLLDALARGVPVLGPRRALAGLPLEAYCDLVGDDSAASFRHGLEAALDARDAKRARATSAIAALAGAFAPDTFVRALTEHVAALA